jgi:hypothetical protein
MNKLNLTVFAALVFAIPGAAQTTMRANVSGNAVDGKCTIEVNVDGSAEVEVQGGQGRIRNLSGRGASFRRFVCNGVMPANPADFRFRGIDGRGDVQLVQDPRQSGGRIVFRVDDPQGGREGYTVDLEWRGSNGQWNDQDSRGWRGPGDFRGNRDDRDRRYYDERGQWNTAGTARAVQICQQAAAERIQRDGFQNITFRKVKPDNNAGRNDFVIGTANARENGRGRRKANFQFSCSVNLANGQVRSVDVRRR